MSTRWFWGRLAKRFWAVGMTFNALDLYLKLALRVDSQWWCGSSSSWNSSAPIELLFICLSTIPFASKMH
jgi:hypothetical protein